MAFFVTGVTGQAELESMIEAGRCVSGFLLNDSPCQRLTGFDFHFVVKLRQRL